MSYASICDYVGYVGRLLRQIHKVPADRVVTGSDETRFALQAVKRLNGAAKQRARPITAAEVLHASVNVSGTRNFVLSFRVILLAAWYGALRLGQLLPHAAFPKQMRMTLRDLVLDDKGRVLLTSRRSKTNVFQERARTVAIAGCPSNPMACLVTALRELLQHRRAAGLPLNVKLSELDDGLKNFDDFVGVLQRLIPGQRSTPHVKGHITGHSFRRGFTHAALAAGYSIEQIMIHGDWACPDSVLNSYADGGILPSIPLAAAGHPRAAFVAPANPLNMPAAIAVVPARVQAQKQVRAAPPRVFSMANIYARRAEIGQSVALTSNDPAEAFRLKRAREWEEEHNA